MRMTGSLFPKRGRVLPTQAAAPATDFEQLTEVRRELARSVVTLDRLRRLRPRLSSAQPFPRGKAEATCGLLQDSSPSRQDRRLRRDREAWRACVRRSAWGL